MRGEPSECSYATSDAADFQAVSQSYEIRRLRAEVKKWKDIALANGSEELREMEEMGFERRSPSVKQEDDIDFKAENETWEQGSPSKRDDQSISRLQNAKNSHGLYFGAPSMSTVVAEVAYKSFQQAQVFQLIISK